MSRTLLQTEPEEEIKYSLYILYEPFETFLLT